MAKDTLKVYKDVGAGLNLNDAMMKSCDRYGTNNIIGRWIEGETKYYLSEDKDGDYIERIIDKFFSLSESNIITNLFIKNNIDLDALYDINRNDLKKLLDTELTGQETELVKKLIDKLENRVDDFGYEIEQSAWECFNDMYPYKTEEDTEIEDFFGRDFPITGYEIDGEEYSLDAVFVCPCCEEAVLQDEQENDWNDFEMDDEPYNHTEFFCKHCNSIYKWADKKFMEVNKQIKIEQIVARCV
jgi:hypothetical protein